MKRVKRSLAVLLALILITGSVPASAFAVDGGDPSAGSWQIVDEGGHEEYSEVHLNKEITPGESENEFTVHMGVDAHVKQVITSVEITRILELNNLNGTALYWGTPGNGGTLPDPHPDEAPGAEGSGAVADNNDMQKPRATATEEGSPFFRFNIMHNGILIAEPKIQLVVPNSMLYLRITVGENPDKDHDYFIMLGHIELAPKPIHLVNADGSRTNLVYDEEDGAYPIPVNLTDMAYNCLLNKVTQQEETIYSSTIFTSSLEDSTSVSIV
ncbi:MAG: hypothetical protein II173_01880, partial [Firmicutes bacterium]|nr:hypothetical protein [Bacillota bacterium]